MWRLMTLKNTKTIETSSQHDRFVETARELGADTDPGALDRVFGKVVSSVLPKSSNDGRTSDIDPGSNIKKAKGWQAPKGTHDPK